MCHYCALRFADGTLLFRQVHEWEEMPKVGHPPKEASHSEVAHGVVVIALFEPETTAAKLLSALESLDAVTSSEGSFISAVSELCQEISEKNHLCGE